MLSSAQAEDTLHRYSKPHNSSCYVEKKDSNEIRYDCSVIIPVYNSECYLRQCLDSIKCQKTAYSFQVIIVNDGSTDSSEEILLCYENEPNWVIIHQKNQGLSNARNVGIDLAEGRYLMFVDSDDRISPNAVNQLVTTALEHNADLVVGGHRSVLEDGNTVLYERIYRFEKVNPYGCIPGFACAKLYSRELFFHLRFPEGYWFEDSILAQIVWSLAKRVYTIPDVIYYYTYNPKGIVNRSAFSPKAMDSLYVTELLLREREKFGVQLTTDDLEHFLHMVRLTYSRTCICPVDVARSVFVAQCEMYKRFSGLKSSKLTDRKLEAALKNRNYKGYMRAVWSKLLFC